MIVVDAETEEGGDADGSGADMGDAHNDTDNADGSGNTEDCNSSPTRQMLGSTNVPQGRE